MEKGISVGLMGFGTVGMGVFRLIENHREKLQHQLGCDITVKRILVVDPDKHRDIQVNSKLLTVHVEDILEDPEIDIVIEVMGGIEQTRDYLKKAFQHKKHVVTANKDLMALHGTELENAASRNQCDLLYEASVAGGIPIIRTVKDGLIADEIQKITGIVNGTTNYILTKMDDEGLAYEDALQKAQELGFAEADPSGDVDGLDAARKMAILARLAFSVPVDLADVEVRGIRNFPVDDLKFGRRLGLTMKLVGVTQVRDHQVEVGVEPVFLPEKHPLAAIKNENNAVFVNSAAVGETMYYGPGAGSLPTAAAVMSDVAAVVKNMITGIQGKSYLEPSYEKKILASHQRFGSYYVRLHVQDVAGSFTIISSIFNELDISFERILQVPKKQDNGTAEVIIVTHETTQDKIGKALENLQTNDVVEEVKSSYRIEGGMAQ
ncbi:homoserine dehydrogenase [Virgibacillus siamensis]|uniref:homoserine dehydrogenase n=1 Tax=Virgibacillus siamensis TaxID=480071 RepID=UPI000986ED6F|nr:homoserine dehydrogenase [Virgibacillus siamensis]